MFTEKQLSLLRFIELQQANYSARRGMFRNATAIAISPAVKSYHIGFAQDSGTHRSVHRPALWVTSSSNPLRHLCASMVDPLPFGAEAQTSRSPRFSTYQAPPHRYATSTSQHHRGRAYSTCRGLQTAGFDLSGPPDLHLSWTSGKSS
jgi:hypothetical protein